MKKYWVYNLCPKREWMLTMEREDYQKRINDLIGAVSTLLDANKVMGEKVAQLEKKAAAYDDLKAVIKRMESQTGSDYPECEQAR